MSKRARKSADDRKKEIVETAIRLAGDLGPDRLTTQHVADEIGISQPAIFRHFPNKGAIWLAVAKHISGSMRSNAIQGEADDLVGEALLRKMALGHLGFVQRTPAIPAILFSQELHAENEELREFFSRLVERNHLMFSRVVQREIVAGGFRHDLNADDAAYLVLALIQGLAMRWSLSNRSFDLVVEGARLLDIQIDAFRVRNDGRKEM